MKLGFFDSGLGGLIIARSVMQEIPQYDTLYFGDTLHLPYGGRSSEAIYKHCTDALRFMFEQDCALIVMACNTASVRALRQVQQKFLPENYPDRNVIGVVVPTLEEAAGLGVRKLGVIGTEFTIASGVYVEELSKIAPEVEIVQAATPLLVPMIEHQGDRWLDDVLRVYLEPLLSQDIEALILGCTHYALLKERIQNIVGVGCKVLSQDDLIPGKLREYLRRHPEYDDLITKNHSHEFFMSDVTTSYIGSARDLYKDNLEIKKAAL